MKGGESEQTEGIEVCTYFVRGRNALVARADFAALYVDYYLHLADHRLRHEPTHDTMLKDALAAVTLHAASRPWNESVAWTLHFEEPLVNLFVSASTRPGRVVGHLFTENVKSGGENLLYSDVVRERSAPRRSTVPFTGASPFRAVEELYLRSEQRPARYFHLADEDFVMISAQPDCDLEWLSSLEPDDARNLDSTETLSLLERRRYDWRCGCDQDRILNVLAPAMRADNSELFGDEEVIRINCPRCGGRYTVTREMMEAYLHAHPEA